MERGLTVISQTKISPTNAAAVAAAAPAGARGFYISVATNAAVVSLDGTTATATNGLRLGATVEADYIPIARDLSVIGTAAAASDVFIVWVK